MTSDGQKESDEDGAKPRAQRPPLARLAATGARREGASAGGAAARAQRPQRPAARPARATDTARPPRGMQKLAHATAPPPRVDDAPITTKLIFFFSLPILTAFCAA